METRGFISFAAGQRPVIEVRMGKRWLVGELRSWIRRDPEWWAHIEYTVHHVFHTATVPAGRIRSIDLRAQVPEPVSAELDAPQL